MTKMTRKEMFTEIAKVVATVENPIKEEMVEFLNHQIELLDKKGSKSGPTKTQLENEKLMADLLEAMMEMEKPVTITEFQKLSSAEVSTLSNQKLNALLKKLKEDGKIYNEVIKKKSYFSVEPIVVD